VLCLEVTPNKAQNVLQEIIRVFAKAFVSHDSHTLFALEESAFLGRPIPAGPSRKPSPHRSESPTVIPRRRHRKKEKNPHVHTDK
jgi:hypothetical protein